MTRRHEGHIRKRNGAWEIRYSLGADAAGRRRTITATVRGTERDAKQELRRRLEERDRGAHVDPSRVTVKDFVERWLKDWAALHVTPKTAERYGELLRRHVAANIGHVQIQKLRPATLAELYAKLLRTGRDDGAGLAPRTVGHVHRVLHRCLGHAVLWNVVQSNASDSVSPPRVATEEIRVVPPAVLYAAIERLKGQPLYTIAALALATGMRRGELLALRWQDVVIEGTNQPFVRVERSVEQTKVKRSGGQAEGGLRFKAPKTKHGRRTISLPAFGVDILRTLWKAQQEQRLALGIGKAPQSALLFSSVEGEPIRPDVITKQWAREAAKGGIGEVTFHALRHTHASQLIAAGLDVLTVSRRLGHGSPTITLSVYGHLFTNSDDRAALALDAAFSSTPK